jgi:hypothetical protein
LVSAKEDVGTEGKKRTRARRKYVFMHVNPQKPWGRHNLKRRRHQHCTMMLHRRGYAVAVAYLAATVATVSGFNLNGKKQLWRK